MLTLSKESWIGRDRSLRDVIVNVAIFGVAALLIFSRLPSPFLEPEESRYAEIPRQMLAAGRYVIPILDGQDYLDKPPLLYWAVMVCYKAFGVTVWSARFVPCMAAWVTIVVVYCWVRRARGREVATWSAALLTLSGDFMYRSPMLTMNGLLCLFVTCAWAAGHLAMTASRQRWGWWLVSAVCCALGLLTKGPIAMALVLVPLATLGRFIPLPAKRQALGWLCYLTVVSIVAAPWFLAVALQKSEFIRYFLWKHHVERVLQPFDHEKPFWFYAPQVLLGFFPWSLIVAQGWGRWFHPSTRPKPTNVEWLATAAAIWTFLVFSLSGSKRSVYLVPIGPPLAILAAVRLHLFWASPVDRTLLALSRGGWKRLIAATAGAMIVLGLVGLPLYSARFSVPREALIALGSRVEHPPPVVCYPQDWKSVPFYLKSQNVQTFRRGEWPLVEQSLRASANTLVIFGKTTEVEQFLACPPADLDCEERGRTGLVWVGIVRRRSN
jgi:4-amino-4-deoxy-L-arabinose transferase-like glycosyltransferase